MSGPFCHHPEHHHADPAPPLSPGDALLVVDVQVDFLPGGALAVADGERVIPVLNRWIAACAQRELPVVFSRDWHPAGHCSFQEQGGPWPPHCVQGSVGARFDPDLLLPPGLILVSKAAERARDAYSAFDGSGLAQRLHGLGVRRLWVAGLALDYCVLHSALGAVAAGFQTLVILDATRAVEQKLGDGARAVERLRAAGVQVVEGGPENG